MVTVARDRQLVVLYYVPLAKLRAACISVRAAYFNVIVDVSNVHVHDPICTFGMYVLKPRTINRYQGCLTRCSEVYFAWYTDQNMAAVCFITHCSGR